jgi:hypothetical protein
MITNSRSHSRAALLDARGTVIATSKAVGAA